MNFIQLPPPQHLSNYVRYFWTLENEDAKKEVRTFRTMADGCPGIIFQPPEEGAFHKDHQQLPGLFLYGQSTKYSELLVTGRFRTIGVCFYPNALRTVFGMNAEELTDSCMALDQAGKKQDFSLAEQLYNTGAADEQVRILSAYLFSLVQNNNRTADEGMQVTLSQIIHSKGNLSLKALQDSLSLTERSFERKFKQWVGISPKLFCRIYRFQASLIQLRNKDYGKLSDIAFENDYSDQSHLIRSFKEFAGISPNQYQKQYNELVENFSELVK